MQSDPRGWLDRAVGTCLSLLVAALALYVAVALLQAILPWLVGLGLLVALVVGWRGWMRSRW